MYLYTNAAWKTRNLYYTTNMWKYEYTFPFGLKWKDKHTQGYERVEIVL